MISVTPNGRRDTLVTIQQRQTADTTGESRFPIEDWTTLTTAWMSKSDATGQERYRADQLSAPYDTTWVMPYQPLMDPERLDIPKLRRLLYLGRVHDITSARPVGGGVHVEIELRTITKAGAA